MAKTKVQKKEIIEDLKQNLTNQKAVVFVGFQGLDTKTLFEIRDKLKEADCLFKVTKKTLLKLVFESIGGSPLKEQIKKMEGELALVFGFNDEIIPAKIVYQFSRENENLKILGGIIKNQKSKIKDQKYQFLSVQEVIDLALLPSKEEVFARLVGVLNAPIANFANVLRENIKGLIYTLKAIKETK